MNLLPSQRMRVVEAVRRAGTATVDQVVDAVGLSKTAVRSHLLTLERRGLVERAEVEHAGPGRPPVAYRLADGARSLFPSGDGEILTALLGFLEDGGHGDLIEAFFTGVWREREAEYHAELEARAGDSPGLADRLAALEVVLERSHFMPEIEHEARAGLVVVNECNCPLPAAVRATRVPCRLEAEFLTRVLGAAPGATRLATPEQPRCVFEFSVAGRS